LVGREAELDGLRARLDAARDGRSAAVLVHGEAGIGKTALLDAVVAQADGVRVLRARGYEAEVGIAFAGLHDLVTPLLDLRDRIPELQARAINGALALEPPSAQDRFALPAGLLSLIGAAAEDGPVLVVVDDLQWVDEATTEALLFVTRRLVADGVIVLLAARDGEPWPFDPTGIERLTLTGLTESDARRVLGGREQLSATVAEALVHTAAGNPLALRELAGSLSPQQRGGQEPLPSPLPPGEGIERAYTRRLAALGDDTRRALVVLAAMQTRRSDLLFAAMAELGIPADALDAAEAAGLVVLAQGRCDLAHPLLRATIYHAAGASQRRTAHGALATVAPDAQRRAWHLAHSATVPDEAVAAELEAAALDARARGGQATSARAFLRAADLSPEVEARARRLLEAATDEVAVGHAERALQLAEDGLQLTGDAALGTQLRRIRGQVALRRSSPALAHQLLTEEAESLASTEPAQAAILLLEACGAPMMTGDMAQLRATAGRARELAEGLLDPVVLIASLLIGASLVADGNPQGEAMLAELERPLLDQADLAVGVPDVVVMAGHCAIWIEAFERADAVLTRQIQMERAASALGRLTYPLAARAHLDLRRGRWTVALADADESVRLARDTGHLNLLPLCLSTLARVEAALGRTEEARAHAEEAAELARAAGANAILLYAQSALGFEALSGGRLEEAAEHLERSAETAAVAGIGEPALVQWAPDRVEALVRLGRTDDAQDALDAFEAQAARTGRTWAQACVQRGRGMLASDDDAPGHFEAALELHDLSPQPFERARTQLVYGERLRRAGQRLAARPHLSDALTTFDRLGARPWADRARGELNASGRTARKRDASAADQLTPQELQIAALVSEGLTNREIGAALFLSPKTIEYHLRSVFRKLDVRSRIELARTFAADTAAVA
jgi:DNA-binding CsgD family transcriptional regulator